MKTKLFLTSMALFALVAVTQAQNTTNNRGNGNGQNAGTSFVDNNNNGTCDNYENRTTIRRGNANRRGGGSGYGRGNRQGRGKGNGNGQGNGSGKFVDVNKNGICDNRE